MADNTMKEPLAEVRQLLIAATGLPAEWDGTSVSPAGQPDGGGDWSENLRLCVKYLVFDLESTRRENQILRKLLEMHPT